MFFFINTCYKIKSLHLPWLETCQLKDLLYFSYCPFTDIVLVISESEYIYIYILEEKIWAWVSGLIT